MLQLTYTKRGHSFTCETTPEFQAAYDETVAKFPILAYPIDMGVKQSVTDSYASKTVPAEIEGAGRKKFDAIMRGEVRVAGAGDRQPTRTPMEREVWKIAMGELSEVFAKLKVAKEKQAAYVRMLITRDWERLEEMAHQNLAKAEAIADNSFDALEDLLSAFDDESEMADKS